MRARDLRGMTETGGSPSAQTGDRTCPFAALLASGSRLISPAESAREAGEKPAVVCAKTDNKTPRFAGCFYGERRDSNPRPPA
jgi:hypothetical protein